MENYEDLKTRLEALTESQVKVLGHMFLEMADKDEKTGVSVFYRDLSAVLSTRLDAMTNAEFIAPLFEGEPLPDSLEGIRWPTALRDVRHERKLLEGLAANRWCGPDHNTAMFYAGLAHQLRMRERAAKRDVKELGYLALGVRPPKLSWEGETGELATVEVELPDAC